MTPVIVAGASDAPRLSHTLARFPLQQAGALARAHAPQLQHYYNFASLLLYASLNAHGQDHTVVQQARRCPAASEPLLHHSTMT